MVVNVMFQLNSPPYFLLNDPAPQLMVTSMRGVKDRSNPGFGEFYYLAPIGNREKFASPNGEQLQWDCPSEIAFQSLELPSSLSGTQWEGLVAFFL